MTLNEMEQGARASLDTNPGWRTALQQEQARQILALIALVREAREFAEHVGVGYEAVPYDKHQRAEAWLEKAKD